MNGDPLWVSSKMKGDIEKLDRDIKSAIEKSEVVIWINPL